MNTTNKRKGSAEGIGIVAIGAVVIVIFLAMMAFVTVDEGDRAVVTTWGDISGEMEPGVNFRVPIMDGVHTYTVREQVAAFGDQSAAQSDLQFSRIDAKTDGGADMQTDIAIGFKLDPKNVTDVYRELGSEEQYYDRLVKNEINSVVRDSASGYTIEELHRQEGRTQFQEDIQERLDEEFSNYGFSVTRVNLENINFGEQIEEAINSAEAKQYEIKEQQRAVEVEKARAEKRRAEAEGLRDSEQIATEAFESESAYLQYLFITEALANEKATNPIYVPTSNGGLDMFKDIDNFNGGQTANASQ